jgi:hypothetical protein
LDDDGSEQEEPDMGAVRVTREVYEGIEAVRRSGLTNMLDRPVVARLAGEMGYEDASRWVRLHRDLYSRAVFHGLKVAEEGEEE